MLKLGVNLVTVVPVCMLKSGVGSPIVFSSWRRQSSRLMQKRQPFSFIKTNRLSPSAVPIINYSLIDLVDVKYRLKLLS